MMGSLWRAEALRVVSFASWVASELSVGCDVLGLPLVREFGFDAPPAGDWAWWMPAAHAARVLRVAPSTCLSSPPPDLLSQLPKEWTGRVVHTSTVESADFKGVGWFKAAEVKTDALPAVFSDADSFLTAARGVLQPSSLVQFSEGSLDVLGEYRFFIRGHRPVSSSAYLAGGCTYYDGLVFSEGSQECEAFASALSSYLQKEKLVPSSYVLDVALTSSGPRVLEFNPLWCSAFYGGDVSEVVKGLVAAADPAAGFNWVPDPYYTARASRQVPLRAPREFR